MSKPRGRYRCAPGGEFTMLVSAIAREGERGYVEFTGFADEEGRNKRFIVGASRNVTTGKDLTRRASRYQPIPHRASIT